MREEYERHMKPIWDLGKRAEQEFPHLKSGDVRFLRTEYVGYVNGKSLWREVETTGWINGIGGATMDEFKPNGGTTWKYEPRCVLLEHNPNYVPGKKGSSCFLGTYSISPDKILAKRDPKTQTYLPIAEWAAKELTARCHGAHGGNHR
jgi:hypothetical protein